MNLWDSVHLGPLNLPLWLPAALLGFVVFGLVVRAVLKNRQTAKEIEEAVVNGALLFLVIWKLSPLLSVPQAIARDPLILLYLPGTALGLTAGFVAASLWFAWRFFKGKWELADAAAGVGAGVGAALAAVMVFALVLSFFPPKQPEGAEAPTAEQGLPPSLVQPTLGGAPADLLAADGKLLILNFWATWCPPCRAEIPGLAAGWKALDARKAVFRTVNLTSTEKDPARIGSFLQEFQADFPVWLDPQGLAAQRFDIQTIPTTLLLAPDGRLLERHVGVITPAELAEWLKRHD